MLRSVARANWRAPWAIAAFILVGCAGAVGDGETTTPTTPIKVVPPAPKPSIVLSSDSVVASLLAGAASSTTDIDITPANETPVAGLVVNDSGTVAGQSAWLSATLSAATAPAKVNIRLTPTTVAPGRYDATLRVTANNAEARTIRVSLVVRPRPRLVLARTSVALSGEVGGSFQPGTIDLTSVNGPIDSLAVSKMDCGNGPSNWLAASLSSARAPATLALSYATAALAAGTYACSVVVSTPQALVDSASQTVRVSLALRAVPRIALSFDSVSLAAYRLSDGSPVSVDITNAGTGTLSGLSLGSIAYGAGGTGWLSATLDSTTAPTSVTLLASARSLATGSYVATLPIQSAAEGVANALKPLVVKLTVLPRPSGLIAIPNVLNLTARAGTTVNTGAIVTVTHTGDSPIQVIGFGPPNPTSLLPWLGPSVGCLNPQFLTPCSGAFGLFPPAGTPPGKYTGVVTYAAVGGVTTSVTVNVTVIP